MMKIVRPYPLAYGLVDIEAIQDWLRVRVRITDEYMRTAEVDSVGLVQYKQGEKYRECEYTLNIYSYPIVSYVRTYTMSRPVLLMEDAPSTFLKANHMLDMMEPVEPPDVLIVQGHGINHPRGFGEASHIGVILGIPAIGYTTELLFGEVRDGAVYIYEEPPEYPQEALDIAAKYELAIPSLERSYGDVRASVMTFGKVDYYISPGHLINQEYAELFMQWMYDSRKEIEKCGTEESTETV